MTRLVLFFRYPRAEKSALRQVPNKHVIVIRGHEAVYPHCKGERMQEDAYAMNSISRVKYCSILRVL